VGSSLIQRLKAETQASHAWLERRVDLPRRLRTSSGYRSLLEAFYGLYCPLESEIERSFPEIAPWLPDIAERMRAASLRLDLCALGNTCPEALPCAPVPPLGSLSERFGCLYVLEGSTLGGQFIIREIASHLSYTPENGCSFFASHGAKVGGMWRQFREAIESYSAAHPDSETQDRVVNSAEATFRAFAEWMERAE
jgi:heme oxygenase